MPLSAIEAADIARRHGLTLQDAAGLASLAIDTAEAEQLAARFAAVDPPVSPAAHESSRQAALLTVAAVAERLSIGLTITKRLIADGKIDSVRIGKRRLVPVAALEKFVAELANAATEGDQHG